MNGKIKIYRNDILSNNWESSNKFVEEYKKAFIKMFKNNAKLDKTDVRDIIDYFDDWPFDVTREFKSAIKSFLEEREDRED